VPVRKLKKPFYLSDLLDYALKFKLGLVSKEAVNG